MEKKSWDSLRRQCPLLYKNDIPFDCGYGWYDLIYDLSIKIEEILEKHGTCQQVPEGEENEIFATQIKEKYGTLRFYMSYAADEIIELIREAAAISSQTCEHCGAFAKMRGHKWIRTRCDSCFLMEENV